MFVNGNYMPFSENQMLKKHPPVDATKTKQLEKESTSSTK